MLELENGVIRYQFGASSETLILDKLENQSMFLTESVLFLRVIERLRLEYMYCWPVTISASQGSCSWQINCTLREKES